MKIVSISATFIAGGLMPAYGDINWSGLEFDSGRYGLATSIDRGQWARELERHDALFERIGNRGPAQLQVERERLAARLR